MPQEIFLHIGCPSSSGNQLTVSKHWRYS